MDINDLRSIMTVVSLATFVGIIWWAFSKGRKSRFDEAANLPFADKDVDEAETRLVRRD
ncbi:cbb3-type cytochrome c oxidase subunit 3 [Oryzomicrobium sp.]|uniref:cbb3-type cytochrome oxidase subunit 3 n=1 Tax=Oryzomicrobium sp. TaxID=1911578 RepID=UPI0025CC7629|nr:cbb3-type cytochrome c oxidase subunit 3 [Oryzomicrobium sp.]MCE1241786.1 cbb3-type cytochrome c oxidase subunit 3 [Oryzomicrobium sp.]